MKDEVVDLVYEEEIVDGTLYITRYKLYESGRLGLLKGKTMWSQELENELKTLDYRRLTTYKNKTKEMTK